jgi:hypothetical protein
LRPLDRTVDQSQVGDVPRLDQPGLAAGRMGGAVEGDILDRNALCALDREHGPRSQRDEPARAPGADEPRVAGDPETRHWSRASRNHDRAPAQPRLVDVALERRRGVAGGLREGAANARNGGKRQRAGHQPSTIEHLWRPAQSRTGSLDAPGFRTP